MEENANSQAAECYAGDQEMELEPGQAAEFVKGMLGLIGIGEKGHKELGE